MKMTSAEANKLMRKLYEEHDAVWNAERSRRTFVAATVEDPDEVRPDYDYAETQKKLAELENIYQKGTLKNMSVLLNATDISSGKGYGYGYGYRYGYGYGYHSYDYYSQKES